MCSIEDVFLIMVLSPWFSGSLPLSLSPARSLSLSLSLSLFLQFTATLFPDSREVLDSRRCIKSLSAQCLLRVKGLGAETLTKLHLDLDFRNSAQNLRPPPLLGPTVATLGPTPKP